MDSGNGDETLDRTQLWAGEVDVVAFYGVHNVGVDGFKDFLAERNPNSEPMA